MGNENFKREKGIIRVGQAGIQKQKIRMDSTKSQGKREVGESTENRTVTGRSDKHTKTKTIRGYEENKYNLT